MEALPPDVTELLHDWSQGDPSALEKLIPLVFEELRQIAARMFRRESDGHTLQPTALVNEVYLKLVGQREPDWQNREQFFAVAARMMRRVLMDYGKARQTAKRGKDVVRVPLEEAFAIAQDRDFDGAALDDALFRLAEIDPRQSRIVELRYLFGFEHEEIAGMLGISATTSKREWTSAKLWLYRELSRK